MKTFTFTFAVAWILAWPTEAQQCPDVNPTTGYPLSVQYVESEGPDEYLETFAYAAVHRWRVPSRRRNAYRGWQRVRSRILPPEPRWAADWQPDGRHVSEVIVIVEADGTLEYEMVAESGDAGFDESIETVFDQPMPGGPDWPDPPGPVALRLTFGAEPTGSAATIRFAAHQTPVRLIPGTLHVNQPPGGRPPSATVKYDVSERGSVVPGSVETLRTSDLALGRAIEDALRNARFEPPTSNCRAVRQTVVQTFGN